MFSGLAKPIMTQKDEPLMPDLVMYTRATPCYFVNLARRVLNQHNVPFREVVFEVVPGAREQVVAWTGFESVPTLIIAAPGETQPHQAPAPLPSGDSPRGIDRGSMMTEPNELQLRAWLVKHGLLDASLGG